MTEINDEKLFKILMSRMRYNWPYRADISKRVFFENSSEIESWISSNERHGKIKILDFFTTTTDVKVYFTSNVDFLEFSLRWT